MNKSAIFSKAHNLVKKVIKAGDNYAVTFGACLKVIYEDLKMTTKTFIVYFSNAWTGVDYQEEIQAESHKDAVEKFEAANNRKIGFVSEKPAKEIETVEVVEDVEDALYQMDLNGTDSIKFKAHNRSRAVVITRKQCVDYINYLNEIRKVKKMTRRQALAS